MLKVTQIRHIEQEGPHTFQIEWTDGIRKRYRLADLQRACPCANCRDEATGLSRVSPETVPDDLTAVRLYSVGRYGMGVQFSTGCSAGIFGYDQLYELGTEI